ncbi:hypothetical protein OROMI_031680 [Orobanche minor]
MAKNLQETPSRLQKRIIPQFLRWVPLLCAKNNLISLNNYSYVNGPYHILQQLRFGSIEIAFNLKNGGNLGELAKRSRLVREEAQSALTEYFNSTRSLQIMDAENMGRNTPIFLGNLLKRVEISDAKVGHSLARFLRYHPVNEFEPFFESIGLKPSEYSSFLPQKLMFLNDDELLLENYHALCNYGIPRNRIGRIYKEAREVFGYDFGVLSSKLQSFRNFGLERSFVIKIVASCPNLLVGSINRDFVEVLEKLKKVGIGFDRLEKHISWEDSYDWKCMLELICSLRKVGLSDEHLRGILTSHPDILLESSGRITFCLYGFLLKLGSTTSSVRDVFLEFPEIPVVRFAKNLSRCYQFLVEIKMDVQDIGRIVCSHPTVLGSCRLKTVKSLLSQLNCGQMKLCQMINQDPCMLKKWLRGLKVDPLPGQKRVVHIRKMKMDFLSSLGYVEKSEEMEKALKRSRGDGSELHQRFDCLVKLGLSRDEAIGMIKVCPQILNQSIDIIRFKVDFFVKELGYPVADLVAYPKVIAYTVERVKVRLLMYKWLKGEGTVRRNLTLSTLLSISDERFESVYVNSHPRGHEYWERLKKQGVF